jgi:hypothetical protein
LRRCVTCAVELAAMKSGNSASAKRFMEAS